ncbi:succinate dehydrogenase cytochrome b subunit [Rubinisphaera sp.]|uniref:succinate dehydrogenase cytochrome b subunit n=1 Tax=Rubinisphaera sp. TaxID=2024857 RepID=UPI000C0D358A|nr:succinate dehydrogenase cytochrome b subunit [Rubinisphaera sp.]MBV07859.1 succinate dehydrogenase [Rubinisphaera sp.]HCS50392.1 succinate dehydrogenase [Planctomycetaceae bacterium]|tara:strand:- start:1468 stop:2289 length:822 start_codon:yes stop_codon:yes gene_type:complete
MAWVTDAIKSSIGKKFLMACTGFLLCGFLVMHLIGNLLMYVGPDVYNNYAHTLHSQEMLIKVAEFGLLILFAIHIWLGFETNLENRESRKTRYAVKKSKIPERKIPYFLSPENYMLFTGVIVFIFLLIHLGDFTFNITMPDKLKGREPYDKAIIIMRTPLSTISYIIGVLLLGWHLSHGVTSMFQTLGLKHPKYDPMIRAIGPVFAVIIAVGFASFPIYAWLIPYDPYAAPGVEEHQEKSHSLTHSDLIAPLCSHEKTTFEPHSAWATSLNRV